MKNLFKFIGLAVCGVLALLAARTFLKNVVYIGDYIRYFSLVGIGFTVASAMELIAFGMLAYGAINVLVNGRVGSTNKGITLLAVAFIAYVAFNLISVVQAMPFIQALVSLIGYIIRLAITFIVVVVVAKLMEKEK